MVYYNKTFLTHPFLKQSPMNLQQHSESQSFTSSEYRPNEESSGLIASCDLPIRKRGKRSKRSQGRASSRNCRGKGYFWSPQDNARYRQFLEENSALFGKSLKERKSLKIHFLMSQHIKTRNPKQCRSHHQKMTKAHGSLESIVAFIEGLAKEQQEKVQDRLQAQAIAATKARLALEASLSREAKRIDQRNSLSGTA